MKNLKKLLAVIIAIAMMATMMVPAFAEGEISADAQTCANLGVLLGEGNGVTSEYLAKETVRLQAAIIFLRFLGKDQEALAYDEWEDNFTDADQVNWAGGRNVLAYLKANPDLGWVGNPDGSFDPNGKASAQMIYKVLLEALGYKAKVGDSEDYDFDWAGTIEFAADKGLTKIADVENVTNDDLATALVEALKAEIKEGGKTLIEKLVEDGIVDKAKAIEEGLIADELKATVAATGAKKLTVSFNKEIDTSKVQFTVKKGSIVANIKEVTFGEDKKSAILEMATYLTKGTYTVTVKGLDKEIVLSVDVEDQKVAGIEFTSDVAALDRADANDTTILAYYKVYNQYGEDISGEAVDVTAGKGNVISKTNGEIKIQAASAYVIGEKVPVSIVHAQTGTFASAVLTVGAKAQVAEISITELKHAEDKELVANSNDAGFYLVVEAKDQYGNAMTNATYINTDVMVTVSNPSVADVSRTDTTPQIQYDTTAKILKLYLVPKGGQGNDKFTAGTSTVMLISKTTGNKAVFDIVVKEETKVDTLTLTAPDLVAAGDQNVEIAYTAVDQFGNELTKNLEGKVQFTTPDPNLTIEFKYDKKADRDKLILNDGRTNPQAGTVIISALTGTNKFVTLTINFKDKAVPSVIAGTKDFTSIYALKDSAVGSAKMKLENIIVHDQYGRVMDSIGTYTIKVSTSDADKVTLDGAGDPVEIANANVEVTFAGNNKGSATITLELYDGANPVRNSAYTFTAKTIELKDVASYAFEEVPLLKDGSTKNVTVVGKDANGNSVALPDGTIEFLTTDNPAIVTVNSQAMNVTGVKEGTANISAWIGSEKVATTAVNVSEADPVPATAKFAKELYTVIGTADQTFDVLVNGNDKLQVKDQYGEDYTNAYTEGIWVSSDKTIATVANGLLTIKASGLVKITYIAPNGITAETEVDVTVN